MEMKGNEGKLKMWFFRTKDAKKYRIGTPEVDTGGVSRWRREKLNLRIKKFDN